jgi:predicted  nucleic acid-binding Zn-ribbon protein
VTIFYIKLWVQIMIQIHRLLQLQKFDSEIDEKKKRLGEVLKAQNEPQALQTTRKKAETVASDLKTWLGKYTELTLEISGVADKITSSEERLYSGKVTKPKELADLQAEVEALGRRKALLEDEVRLAFGKMEAAEKEKITLDEELETAVSSWESQSAHLKAEQNKLALHLHKLMQARKAKAEIINAASMKEYEHLRKQKNGLAVAGLRVNMCLGCRTTVSANKAREVDEGHVVYCGGCGRLLGAV